MRTVLKRQMYILEQKSATSEVKYSLHRFQLLWELAKEIFSKPKDRSVEIIQSEERREKKKLKEKLTDPLWLVGKYLWFNRQEIGVPEWQEIKWGKSIYRLMKPWLKISQICLINISGSKPPRWPSVIHTVCYSHHCVISCPCVLHGPVTCF